MNYVYKTIYNFEGISHPADKPAQTIYQSDSISVTLTSKGNLNEVCHEIDQKSAYGNAILRALHKEGREKELETEIAKTISEIQAERNQKHNTGGFAVIEVTDETELITEDKFHRELRDVHLYFDALNSNEIKNKHRQTIEGILSSISLALDSRERIHKVADSIICSHPDGKPILSFTMEVGRASVVLSKNITEDISTTMSQLIDNSTKQTNLKISFRLYNNSLNKNENRFKAFMNSWMALEVFIGKMFSEFETQYASSLEAVHETKALGDFLQRTKTVMKDKYRPLDKFTLIASFISDTPDEDIETFKRIKKIRNDLSHGAEVNDDDLPLEETRTLTGKILKNYLLK